MSNAEGPKQGLFAFYDEEFYHVFQDRPDVDHVEWFEQVGLPSHGPAYDAILRGKVTYDLDTDRVIVGFYGAPYLSNRRYNLVIETFDLDEGRVVEKQLTEPF